MAHIKTTDADTYRYLNFDQLPEYVAKADQVCDVYGYFFLLVKHPLSAVSNSCTFSTGVG